MKIAYTGPVSIDLLMKLAGFNEIFCDGECRFDLNSYLLAELGRRGHRIFVVKQIRGLPTRKVFEHDEYTVVLMPGRSVSEQYRGFYHQEVVAISRELKSYCPDVVLATWTYQFARAAIVSGLPTLVVAHDSPWRILWIMRDKSRLLRTLYAQLLVFPFVRALVAVSPTIVRDMRRFNWYRKRVELIPNAITPEHLINYAGKEIREVATTLVCVSQWSKLKNVQTLLHAFVNLRKRHAALRLALFGHGLGKGEEAETYMIQKGLSTVGIEFFGFCNHEKKREFFDACADVFVSPSLEESFGLVFIEAMARGLPCIGGARSGAVPWVLGDAGVVCDVSRAEALSRTVEDLLPNFLLRKELSKRARLRVESEFAFERFVDRYECVLDTVVKKGAIE